MYRFSLGTVITSLFFLHIHCTAFASSLTLDDAGSKVPVSCCYLNSYREELVPDPQDWTRFFMCESRAKSSTEYITVPIRQECPDYNETGEKQWYDFRQCKCLRPREAEGFNALDLDHRKDMFNCTKPFLVDGAPVSCIY